MFDNAGDILKQFEMEEAGRRMMPEIPVIVRLDGRAFHTYTRGMDRPYDVNMQRMMAECTKSLVDKFHAVVGYTQSDEITLVWKHPKHFDGRYQKMTSVLAGYTSGLFNKLARGFLTPEPKYKYQLGLIPHFDARAYQVPTLDWVIRVLAWREADAVRNSVAMAAQSLYSHRQLHGKGRTEMMDMLHAKGVNWNDYPVHFKRGAYFKRFVVECTLSEDERARIPEKNRPAADHKFLRGRVLQLDIPPINQVAPPYSEILAENADFVAAEAA